MGQNMTSGNSSADALQDLPQQVVSYQKRYDNGYRSSRHSRPRHQLIYSVSGLMMAELCALTNPSPMTDKAHHLSQLILLELSDAPTSLLALPYPEQAGLRRVCDALVAQPATDKTIDHWAHDIGASRRSFTRKFQQQTGISFGQWTQRLRCQLALAGGTPIHTVARDLGYASPYTLRAMMQRYV
jgi:AraC-like DNA-binding protein